MLLEWRKILDVWRFFLSTPSKILIDYCYFAVLLPKEKWKRQEIYIKLSIIIICFINFHTTWITCFDLPWLGQTHSHPFIVPLSNYQPRGFSIRWICRNGRSFYGSVLTLTLYFYPKFFILLFYRCEKYLVNSWTHIWS